MSRRKPNRSAVEQRAIAERYGKTQRSHLYRRLRDGRPFGMFVVDGRLSLTTYPSAQHTWLEIDCRASLVGVYIDMPDWSTLLHDLEATEAAQQAAAAQPTAA